ncbi:alpha/beta hydrolase family esterase [Candidatus Poriferisodalis sp.]|uniref:alpha/beta hydrolase family esterase n=1 Tax=Candidatus Poriferisodalis sp. TaxID=3101277 RepID=UPI003B026BBB
MRLLRHCILSGSWRVGRAAALVALIAAACTSTAGTADTTERPTSTPGVESGQATETTVGGAPATSTDAPEGCVPDADVVSQHSRHRLASGGNEYEYLLYVPGSASALAPLVMNFHGLGGDGAGQAAYSGYSDLADAEGFVTVHPSGLVAQSPDQASTWGAVRSWEGIGADTSARDDMQFVSDLIDRIAAQACIDRSRVYATGFSNGGYFSAYLVCELADRIAATFSVGGISHPEECQPSRPVAMGAMHGTEDEVVPFDDGRESVLVKGRQIDDRKAEELEAFFAEIIPDELAEFAAAFDCTVVTESEFDAATSLTRYTGCDGGVELRFYAIEGAGHIWPGSSWDKGGGKNGAGSGAGISATADGWAFMSKYSLNQ